ncbi:MAG: DUF2271 domain-containing protein [Kiritimatiellaceae bacterium]|nr:DUF2271 domain-containing protein [Kiritimatiellaceae bacterium]
MKSIKIGLLLAGVFLGVSLSAEGVEKTMELTVSLPDGTGDNPMVVLWLEKDTGEFVQTVRMFSKRRPYYRDLLTWFFKSRTIEKWSDIDAVSGATLRWNKSQTFSIPVRLKGHDLLDGTYVLRFESRKDGGNHHREFKIPLPNGYAGGKHEDAGYVQSVEITIKDGVDSE